MTGYRRINLN